MTDDVVVISSDSDSDVEVICSTGQPEVCFDATKCVPNVNINLMSFNGTAPKCTNRPALPLSKSKAWRNTLTSCTVVLDPVLNSDHPANGGPCDSPDSLQPWGEILQNTAHPQTTGRDYMDESLLSEVEDNPVSSIKDSSVMTIEHKENHMCTSKLSTSPSSSKIEPVSSNHTSHDPALGEMLFSLSNVTEKKQSDLQSEPVSRESSPSPVSCGNKCLSPPSQLDDVDGAPVTCMGDLTNEWDHMNFNMESSYDGDSCDGFEAKTQFVCPVALNQLVTGQTLAPLKEEETKPSQLLTHQMLNLIYCTMEENYTEGTLQLVSDFLKSGCHPPKNITKHLLCNVLLNPHGSPYHRVCAFNLLMKTQRHHMADRDTVPWSWELLSSVMNNEMLRSQVVRMFLEYVLQTLTEDYAEKRMKSDLNNSIAKATLSCERHFSQVRDVIRWLSEAIVRSPDSKDITEVAKESDEKMRIVSSLQRMLSLALEVDQCPALISSKLCQELFNTLITSMHHRAHRMMFLESLQSQPLRCKLLEQLLDYTCPVKVRLPMSLSLLLHFLRNCVPIPDLKSGGEKWREWEELLQLLWMLLLSYNKTMKGYLSTSASTHSSLSGGTIFKKEDQLTKASVCEAVDTFRSRFKNVLDDALPFHVEELLSYLMDYLLNICQE